MNNNEKDQIIIDIEPISRRVKINSLNKTLYELLIDIDVRIRSECQGRGTCGKCKLKVENGDYYLNSPTNSELKLLNKNELENGYRLACQTKIIENIRQKDHSISQSNMKIYLPENLLLEEFQILTSGIGKGVNLNPSMIKIFLKIPKALFNNQTADVERIFQEISKIRTDIYLELDIDYELLKIIPELLKNQNSELTVTIRNKKRIINLEPRNQVIENYGIAIDIGTTTLVGYLINLNDKKIYAIDSKLNPQTQYGEDVISRISFIKDNKNGLEILNSLIIKQINKIIFNVCKKANIHQNHINEATIVGNSIMHHIFLGLNPTQIGISPYTPILQKSINIKAKELKLNIFQNGNIHILPLIAGFVGADTMGLILSSKIYEEETLTLAIDIGTNGEIVIGNKDVLAVGSCAAGSALEGAHIKHGMRAAEGAIDSVKINPENLELSYTTIKNKKPIGICGSGLIDVIAEMLKVKILTQSGLFNKKMINNKDFIINGNEIEYIIVNEKDTLLKSPITLSINDIRQIQMAKAAFYSGVKIMIKNMYESFNINTLNIEKILLAGAFGNYINKDNAKFIGMIPDINTNNIFQIGNAAGIGAQYSLLDINVRKEENELLKKIRYIEIANDKTFQREYAEAMYFPHINLNIFKSLKEYQNIPKR
ncbi:MAG: DUF4445 domain-containing protein [Candidatus Lokiarchaeota archaeon]|nr:DUF4445 domain-containing protein [Candidatus Lokiarchaeota archaeon]